MQLTTNIGGTTFSWKTENSCDASLQISEDSNCSFNQFLKIMSGQQFELIPEKYAKISEHFVSASHYSSSLVPRDELKIRLKNAETIINDLTKVSENSLYLQDWVKSFEFLQSMKRAKIDKNALDLLMQQRDAEDSKTLKSFIPESDGYARKVTYNVADSVTGRIKVSSGPLVLTTHHDVRNCIRSTFENGSVLSIDFRSVEPRISLLFVGKKPPEDVYSDLLEEFPDIGRPAAKLATLVALYGGKVNRLAEVLGDLDRARKSVSFVKAHFRVDELERRLSEQAEKDVVRNVLGRPLREATKNPRIRTNHFLQSSAAELAPLLFSELCQKFQVGIRPLFVIHDALIVDVHPDFTKSFSDEAESILWKGHRMPVKIERLHPI